MSLPWAIWYVFRALLSEVLPMLRNKLDEQLNEGQQII